MKNLRIWFKKDDECRFISHLDLNRCVLRALHKSRIPIWHTEGFNTHPYVTFPLPLSLGVRGINECMDVRLIEDYDFKDIINNLNDALPMGIRVFNVTEPEFKSKDIAFASYKIKVTSDKENSQKIYNCLDNLLKQDQILVEKKTKKKGFKEIDIKPYIKNAKIERNIGCANLDLILPAGSVTNINPNLLQNALSNYFNIETYFDITKVNMFTEKMETFK